MTSQQKQGLLTLALMMREARKREEAQKGQPTRKWPEPEQPKGGPIGPEIEPLGLPTRQSSEQ